MIELETPQQHEQPIPSPRIEEVSAEGDLSAFEVSPLQEGYGVTLGNALRRVLLSSLEGAAVTSVQIAGVFHEFSTIENVKEDVTQIVLNIKKLRLRSFARHPITLKLVKRGGFLMTFSSAGRSRWSVTLTVFEGACIASAAMASPRHSQASTPAAAASILFGESGCSLPIL